jgi:hypothetical protein
MNPPAQPGIEPQPRSQSVRPLETLSKEVIVDRDIAARQKAERNLRFGTIESLSDDNIALVANRNDRTGRSVAGSENIAAINPEMPASDAGRPALSDAH